MEDNRFKHIATDPKFRRTSKGARKVKIDKRFKSMFKDKKFKIKYTVDKRGRPVNHTSTEDLKRYYELSSGDESSAEESEHEKPQIFSEDQNGLKQSDGSSESENNSGEEPGKIVKIQKRKQKMIQKPKLKVKPDESKSVSDEVKNKLSNLNIDYARGEAPLLSESSSDDEESESELSESEQIDHKWGEFDADADQTEETTYRLAACNMDWDRIRAVDLMVLFNSFLPLGAVVKSVAIYPSEFGKQRMQEEEVKGPIELIKTKSPKHIEENEEGSQYHMEKLRQYQLNRLRYYYAVIVFDKLESANKVYIECDGMEYESSAIKLDLRFIPDDMTFDEKPRDFCDQLPEINKYQPRFFATTALQQVKVDLTWDETNPERIEVTKKLNSGKIDDMTEADLQNYLASSSDEEEKNDSKDQISESVPETKTDVINKYKILLQDIQEEENNQNKKDIELEVSWGIDLKQKTEELVKQKQNNLEEANPFQKYLQKRKDKRKEKKDMKKKSAQDNQHDLDIPSDIDMKDPYFTEEFDKPEFRKKDKKSSEDENDEHNNDQAELELLLMNEDDDKEHFNLKKIQESEADRKKKKKKIIEESKDNFKIDVKDERFSAIFTSHYYNIDPTDPNYKKTKAMEAFINEKQKRRLKDFTEEESGTITKKIKNSRTELKMLVKSVKRKTNVFKNKC